MVIFWTLVMQFIVSMKEILVWIMYDMLENKLDDVKEEGCDMVRGWAMRWNG